MDEEGNFQRDVPFLLDFFFRNKNVKKRTCIQNSNSKRSLLTHYIPFRSEVCCRDNDIIPTLYKDWDFATTWRLQQFLQHLQCVLQDIGWTHVDLGNNDKDRNIEGQRQPQMLLSHSYHTRIGSNLCDVGEKKIFFNSVSVSNLYYMRSYGIAITLYMYQEEPLRVPMPCLPRWYVRPI